MEPNSPSRYPHKQAGRFLFGIIFMLALPLVPGLNPPVYSIQEIEKAPETALKPIAGLNQGNLSRSILTLDSILAVDPENVEALSLLGAVYLQMEVLEESARFFQKALKINDDYLKANLGMAEIFVQVGKYHLALKYYRKCLRIDPKNEGAHEFLAEMALNSGHEEDAEKHYSIILGENPTHERALTNMAVIEEKKGRMEAARKYLEKCAAFHPQSVNNLHNLGVLYSKTGRFHDALVQFTKALNINSQNPKINLDLGVLFYNARVYNEACAYFRKYLETHPDDGEIRAAMAICLYASDMLEEALGELAVVCQNADSNRYEVLLLMSEICLKSRVTDRAIGFLRRAVNENAVRPEAHYLLGKAYEFQGMDEAARQETAKAQKASQGDYRMGKVIELFKDNMK